MGMFRKHLLIDELQVGHGLMELRCALSKSCASDVLQFDFEAHALSARWWQSDCCVVNQFFSEQEQKKILKGWLWRKPLANPFRPSSDALVFQPSTKP